MKSFKEKTEQRILIDDEKYAESIVDLASVVMGKSAIASIVDDENLKTEDAILKILDFYKISHEPSTEIIEKIDDRLDYYLRTSGVMKRRVVLEGKWYKDAFGPMLAYTKESGIVALIPKGSNYVFFDYKSGRELTVNSKSVNMFEPDAYCFYKPLPARELEIKDILRYMLAFCSISDFILAIVPVLLITIIGLIMPYASQYIFSVVIPMNGNNLLPPLLFLMVGATLSSTIIGLFRSLILARIQTKINVPLQASAMARIISMPTIFFRDFNSGELTARLLKLNELCATLVSISFTVVLSAIFSLIYLIQIFDFAPELFLPVVIIIIIILLISVVQAVGQKKINEKLYLEQSKLSGLVFSMFAGIQKIKLAGAEKRGFSRWAHQYSKTAQLSYNPPFFLKIAPILATVISAFGMIFIYEVAIAAEIDSADYMAFFSAYSITSGALISLAGVAGSISSIRPTLEITKPILKMVPEIMPEKKYVNDLSGNIIMNHVSFKYPDASNFVLEDISLEIKPGDYIGIVGRTGCGKSTLMRLLLGFEEPSLGMIYYDNYDLTEINVRSLRKKIGSVLQNGKLIQGNIFSNIALAKPSLTIDDAWAAAEMAGIAEDIKAMPMGMYTVIGEGTGGISGGQRQRILIARAIAIEPKILIMDEATSALDNKTQKEIADALAGLNNTRIAIAHRLSTIKDCDRIIVISDKKISEEGTYDELMEKKGEFYELVKMQQLE